MAKKNKRRNPAPKNKPAPAPKPVDPPAAADQPATPAPEDIESADLDELVGLAKPGEESAPPRAAEQKELFTPDLAAEPEPSLDPEPPDDPADDPGDDPGEAEGGALENASPDDLIDADASGDDLIEPDFSEDEGEGGGDDPLEDDGGIEDEPAPAPTEADRSPSSTLEKAALGGAAAIILAIALFFFGSLPDSEKSDSGPKVELDLPIEGESASITALEVYWRLPAEGDHATPGSAIIPEVAASTTGSGYVRFLFRDGDGRIAGDPTVVKVGESARAHSGDGLASEAILNEMIVGDLDPWSVEIYEGSDPQGSGDAWTRLEHLAVPPHVRVSPSAQQ